MSLFQSQNCLKLTGNLLPKLCITLTIVGIHVHT
uniref:Uncharacterized protein n=1 Tax=Anguilla anguilla TaxID=7936 RepID=A0A0E9UK51_ANGAN